MLKIISVNQYEYNFYEVASKGHSERIMSLLLSSLRTIHQQK